MIKIGIIKESRSDDKRTPLTPNNVKELLKSFSNINLIVEPSLNRCFTDQEYKNSGAIISKNLDICDLILGVKEIEPHLLIPSKSYMFFSCFVGFLKTYNMRELYKFEIYRGGVSLKYSFIN